MSTPSKLEQEAYRAGVLAGQAGVIRAVLDGLTLTVCGKSVSATLQWQDASDVDIDAISRVADSVIERGKRYEDSQRIHSRG